MSRPEKPELEFEAASYVEHVFPDASERAVARVVRRLDEWLPEFFAPYDMAGLRAPDSLHYAYGALGPEARPTHVNTTSHNSPRTVDETGIMQIVTGVCLFRGEESFVDDEGEETHGVLSYIYESNGVEATSLKIDDTPLPATLESVYRVSFVARSLIDYATERGADAQVYVHIPTPEYRMAAYSAHRRGLMSDTVLDDYLRAVSERSDSIQQLMEDIIDRSGVKIEFGSPMQEEFPYASPEEASNISQAQKCMLMVPEVVHDAMEFSYAKAYTNAALAEATPVFVDDPGEVRIFTNAIRFQNLYHGVAIYPLPAVAWHGDTSYGNIRSRIDVPEITAELIRPWL